MKFIKNNIIKGLIFILFISTITIGSTEIVLAENNNNNSMSTNKVLRTILSQTIKKLDFDYIKTKPVNLLYSNQSENSENVAKYLDQKSFQNYFNINGVTITNNLIDSKPFYIAHAGGNINNITNSKEGILDALSKGIKYVEIDFILTSDNEYILLHDWGRANSWMNGNLKTRTRDEFINYKMPHGLTMMDLDMLIDLMYEYPELIVITDIKEANDKLLTTIAENYPHYIERFIVQIYEKSEYFLAKSLGYKDIIFSLYQVWYNDNEVVEFANNNDLFAVTMPTARAETDLPKRLSNINVMTYCHTINEIDDVIYYMDKGIKGFYTDFLY